MRRFLPHIHLASVFLQRSTRRKHFRCEQQPRSEKRAANTYICGSFDKQWAKKRQNNVKPRDEDESKSLCKERTAYDTLRILTNTIKNCELLNLGSNKNGPLFAPQGRYWVLNITALTLPENEQEQRFVFQNAVELYATIEKLGGNPVVEDVASEKTRGT